MPGVSAAEGERALWDELERLCGEPVGGEELQKVRNKFEANMLYGEMNVMNKALNLAYYAMLGDLPLVNSELEAYRGVDAGEIMETARRLFRREASATLVIYGSNGK